MQTDSSPDHDEKQLVTSSVAPQLKGYMPWSENQTPFTKYEQKAAQAAQAAQAAMSPLDRLKAKLQQLESKLVIQLPNPSSEEPKLRKNIAALKAEIANYKTGGRKTRRHRKRRMTRRHRKRRMTRRR